MNMKDPKYSQWQSISSPNILLRSRKITWMSLVIPHPAVSVNQYTIGWINARTVPLPSEVRILPLPRVQVILGVVLVTQTEVAVVVDVAIPAPNSS
jgi:hypothetical protein